MEEESLLDEECLALESIFEDKFTRLQPDRIRLIVTPEGSEDSSAAAYPKHECLTSALGAAGSVPLFLELVIPADYPNVAPLPDLSNVNNAAYMPAVKEQAVNQLIAEAQTQLGECMLYNLAEWAKDQIPQWLEQSIAERSLPAAASTAQVQAAVKEESQFKGMSKAQKRRHFDKFGAAEEKPRGWNWVDILSHLSKGPKIEVSSA